VIEWQQTRRDCWIGYVSGIQCYEIDVFLSGGHRRAVLYTLPARPFTKFPNVTKAKEAAEAKAKGEKE
jgi:hypothetical protein